MIKLEQFDYAGATAIALVMLLRLLRAAAADQLSCLARSRGMRAEAATDGRAARPSTRGSAAPQHGRSTEPRWVRWLLIGAALVFLGVFLFVPLASVFAEALAKGLRPTWRRSASRCALAAVRLTLIAAAIAVPLNLVFGLAAAWAIAKFDFRGKNLLITLIDLPFAVSPVISGHDLRPALRRPRLLRALARGARHQDHLRRAGHRAGDDLRDLPRSWPAS